MDISVNTLAAKAAHHLYLLESSGLTIGEVSGAAVKQVYLNSDHTTVTIATLAGVAADQGHAKIETLGGALLVEQAVLAADQLLLAAGGAGSDLSIDASVTSLAGPVGLLAQQNIFVLANGSVQVTNLVNPSTSSVFARTVSGAIVMHADASVTTAGGNIYFLAGAAGINANNSVTLGRLDAGGGNITIIAGWDILDAQNDTVAATASGLALPVGTRVVNLTASNLHLQSGRHIGQAGNPLDTSVDTLAAFAAGNLYVYESTDLAIGTVGLMAVTRVHLNSSTTAVASPPLAGVRTGGHAKFETQDGTLTVAAGTVGAIISGQPYAIVANADILLAAGGNNSDLRIEAAVASHNGAITALAQQDVLQTAAGHLRVLTGSDPVVTRFRAGLNRLRHHESLRRNNHPGRQRPVSG